MSPRIRPLLLLAVAFGGLAFSPAPSRADQYVFTGTVTSVRDPFGAFSTIASTGTQVSGSFQYDGSAPYPSPFQFNPFVTNYGNFRSVRPEVTSLELVIGGFSQRSSAQSLTNLVVGNDVPGGTPFSPEGDFFRYFDTLPDHYDQFDPLVDYSRFDAANSFVVPFARIVLRDPTGSAFSSQDLPAGLLPLSAFTDRYGEFSFFDGNGEDIDYGSIGFRIDSVRSLQAVPEPGTLALLLTGSFVTSATVSLRRRPWRRSRTGGTDVESR